MPCTVIIGWKTVCNESMGASSLNRFAGPRLRGSRRWELVGVGVAERLNLDGLLILALTVVMGQHIANALVVPPRGKWLLLAHRPIAFIATEMNAEPGCRNPDSHQ
jgi:hypothetical protein